MNNKYLLGVIGVLSGFFLLLVGFDLLPVSPGSLHVPRWLMGVIGMMFVLAGISASGLGSFSQRVTNILGAFVLLGFSLVSLWVAFGPGVRTFGGATPLLGRILFAASANFCVLLTMWAIKKSLKQKQNLIRKEQVYLSIWIVGLYIGAIILQVFLLILYTKPDGSLGL
jgi:hypothetical protein